MNNSSKIAKLAFAVFAIAGMSSCAYNAAPVVIPATSVYQGYAEKVPGNYAVFVQSGTWSAKVDPTSWMCSAHNFPVDANSAFQMAATQTIAAVVESSELVSQAVPFDELTEKGYSAQIAVHAAEFSPTISFSSGMFSAQSNATAKATINVVVLGPEGPLFQTAINGKGSAEGPAGLACEGGAVTLAKAIEEASQEIFDRLGERVANSPKLRAH